MKYKCASVLPAPIDTLFTDDSDSFEFISNYYFPTRNPYLSQT
jgi:hypothetical protein